MSLFTFEYEIGGVMAEEKKEYKIKVCGRAYIKINKVTTWINPEDEVEFGEANQIDAFNLGNYADFFKFLKKSLITDLGG